MTFESSKDQEVEISWLSTAERFTAKIDEEIQRIGDNHPRVVDLQKLESSIIDLFTVYNSKKMTISQVEDDLKHRVEHSENEFDKKQYKQILSFIDARFQLTI